MLLMSAIYKREVGSYFTSPVGYAVLAAFTFFSGIFFYVQCLYTGTTNMSGVFQSMFFIVLFIIPLLTMRSFADDRRNKTDQALLTAPVSIPSVVLSKFLSCLTIFGLCLLSFIIQGIAMTILAKADWSVIIGNVFGMLIMGASFISIGLFISSLTESSIVAGIVSFVVNVLISLFDTVGYTVKWAPLTNVLSALSFQGKYANFSIGLFSLADIVFFVTVTALFLFLTGRRVEKRRWA